ncbi:MAG: ASCH domain-containing protein [Prevotellaceae bacterium]|jgi:hypothetical protein|nr:ASCH domain-containing protein [Prevotellaceae bacterium]
MKVLSVKNPWAYLICIGVKDVENRSWTTKYRGTLLIHVPSKNAGQVSVLSSCTKEQMQAIEGKGVFHPQHPMCSDTCISSIIGMVDLVDCVTNSQSIWAEAFFCHWILKNPVLFDHPIENVSGQLNIWDYYGLDLEYVTVNSKKIFSDENY